VVFRRKTHTLSHSDLIDLLLSCDLPTRKRLIAKSLQSGSIKKGEAAEITLMVERLERAGNPWAGHKSDAGAATSA
jgi:hypothetical protein